MTLLNPMALLGLVAIAAPVIAHLLGRRPARRLLFPNLRFLPAAVPSPVRRDRLTDLGLLSLRATVIAAAVLALTQPVWLSGDRTRDLGRQVARAVIVDSSASMTRASGTERAIDVARREAGDAAAGATVARVGEADSPVSLIAGAIGWLMTQPMRRELVIVSDFQTGALGRADLEAVPAGVGLRLIGVAATGPIAGSEGGRELDLIAGSSTRDDATAARAAAIAQGAPAIGRVDRPVAIAFSDSEQVAAITAAARAIDAGWMAEVSAAVEHDALVVAAAARARRLPSELLTTMADSSGGHARLIVLTKTRARDLFSAAVIGALLRAVSPNAAAAEHVATTYSSDELRSWERPAGDVAVAESARAFADSDGRWLWLAALVLLIAEGLVRRRRRVEEEEVRARVA